MTYNDFLKFLNEFRKIQSFRKKIDYANQNLRKIGTGSGRIAYDIDGIKVFKLAKNQKGIAQNEVEEQAARYKDYDDILTNIYESADDSTWLVAEKAKKITEKRFGEITGFKIWDVYAYLKNFYEENHGHKGFFSIEPDIKEKLDNDEEFTQRIANFLMDYSQTPGDLNRISTYGEVIRGGIPSVVLTDYGLTKDVYDTHYSPDRKKKYELYELYDCADGNDDILSDIGDTGEIRHGMWAIIPYGVGDGEGVINEDFISFVLDRDKYPTKPLPSMPYVIDLFHECVNNLKETFKHVNNKKQFYNNLLSLQEYLISQNAYDRERLIKEEYEINENEIPKVRPFSLDDINYSIELANELALKINLGQPQHLAGGSNGHAFTINNNTILKITADVSEADAGVKILRENPKYLAKIYSIYKIVDTEKNLTFFAILQENVVDKPISEFHKYENIFDTILPNGLDITSVYIKMRKRKIEYQELIDIANHILIDNSEANITTEDRNKTYNYFIGIINISQELIQYGIKSWDYGNPSNLGYKDGVLKFFDIGGYGAEEPSIESKNIIYLPEGKENILENFDRQTADRIGSKIVQINQYKHMKYAGQGTHGFAYNIGNDLIMKVTSDKSEAVEGLKIRGKELKHLANIYEIYQINPKSGSTIPESYVIIVEKLKINEPYFDRIVDRLDYAFENILGLDFNHILDDYVQGEYDDKKSVIDRYMSKNPEDAKFYYGLLGIADEVHKYGIESMDYINTSNLGYKKNGNLGFFDIGFGDLTSTQFQEPQKVEIEEDGSSRYSTDNAIGQDEFPPYNQNDTSPITDNNVPPTNEDLEYNYVSDATQDEYIMTERKLSYMPGAQTVTVKKKCRLGGLGNTSVACNQGDINNLDLKKIVEKVINEVTERENKQFSEKAYRVDSNFSNSRNTTAGDVVRFERDELGNVGDFAHITEEKLAELDKYNARDIVWVTKTFEDAKRYSNESDFSDINEFDLTGEIIAEDGDGGYLVLIKRNVISEEIDASEAYTEEGTLKAVLEGRKDVAMVILTPRLRDIVIEAGLGLIKIEQSHHDLNMHLVYRNKDKAEKLYQIIKKHGGYLQDNTPEEAREIGKLLDYSDASIEKFINKRYGNKVPVMPEKSSDDYNDLAEQETAVDFKKQIAKDAITHSLNKVLIRKENDFKIIAVNGDAVKDSGFIKFVDGGHYYVDAKNPESEQQYAKNIPEDEIWIDDVFLVKPNDIEGDILHEKLERHLMKYYDFSYDKAHEIANKAETIFRQKVKEGTGRNIANAIFNVFVRKFTKPNVNIDEANVILNNINEAKLILNNFITILKQKQFIQSLINDLKSDVYVVGGVVRDLILNKPNKDIDLVVGKVPIDTLISHLQKFGKIDVVGKSFGVLKFIDKDGTDYDIALPRKEQPTGEGGYRGFDVQSDENLPIEDELIRRDAKMNAMAINLNTGKFIDPLGGLEDIKNKEISAANPEAFSDDPLRMIRMISFASRFGFTIEPETMKMIKDNASRIKEISPERILTEFDKIVKKSNKLSGAILLKQTGLRREIFGKDAGLLMGRNVWENAKTMGEFIWLLSNNLVDNPAEFYKNNLKGDIDTYKEIKALDMAFENGESTNSIEARSIAHNMYVTSQQSLQSKILPNIIQNGAQELIQGKYPKTVNELAINGNDLMELGLKDKAIGDMQKSLLLKIYANKIKNNREDLLNLVNQNSDVLNERTSERTEYGCLMLFFDILNWNKITSVIDKNDIYDKEGYGIETEPHLSILYGFHYEVTADDVFKLFKENMQLKPIDVHVTGISVFRNPEFDVVKFDINSKELTKLNGIMRQLPNTTSFPIYHPHITIGYVKSGSGKKYIKLFEKERVIRGTKLVFSTKGQRGDEGEKLMLNKKNILKEYNEIQYEKYLVNGKSVGINFFIKKYDKWNNQGGKPGYPDPSKESVLEFFQNNYEDFSHDEKLKQTLLWALTDREVLNEKGTITKGATA